MQVRRDLEGKVNTAMQGVVGKISSKIRAPLNRVMKSKSMQRVKKIVGSLSKLQGMMKAWGREVWEMFTEEE